VTAAWMLYGLVLSALVALVALALERVCAIWGIPRRTPWLLAIVVVVAVPFVVIRRVPARPIPSKAVAQGGMVRAAVARPVRVSPPARPRRALAWLTFASRRFDRQARAVWFAASLVVLATFARGLAALTRQRARWTRLSIDGQSAWLAPDVGPAVVGVIRQQIVIPKWALALEPGARELMLRHEREHIRAGDPQALLAAGALLVLFPWNFALWWMVRRLRLAIEVDCDARVIGAVGRRHEYGMLLLAVGERRSARLPLAASLAQQQPFLERRINAMTAVRPRRPLIASLPLVAIALAATAAAAQTPVPATASGGVIARSMSMDTMSTRSAEMQQLVRTLLTNYFPGVINGTSEARHVAFVLDANDAYVTSSATADDAPPAVAIATPSGGGRGARGSVAVGGSGGGVITASGADVTAPAVAVRVAGGTDTVRAVAVRPAGPLNLNRYGLGTIDRSLIRGTAFASYRAGVMGPNGVDVYIVRLNTTAKK